MSTMQDTYNTQIKDLISTQKSQASEITSIKQSQGTLKNDLELQIHDKIEKQMTVLTSLVDIVQKMQNKDHIFYDKI